MVRKKTAKAPRVPECEVLAACRRLLDALKRLGKLTYRRIHVMPVAVGSRMRGRRNTDMAGMSDLIVFINHGPTLHIETKGSDGDLSDEQRDWQAELEVFGHIFYRVRAVEELIVVLAEHGVRVCSN